MAKAHCPVSVIRGIHKYRSGNLNAAIGGTEIRCPEESLKRMMYYYEQLSFGDRTSLRRLEEDVHALDNGNPIREPEGIIIQLSNYMQQP